MGKHKLDLKLIVIILFILDLEHRVLINLMKSFKLKFIRMASILRRPTPISLSNYMWTISWLFLETVSA